MATRPVDNDWETIKGGDEWEDVTGVEDARQQLLNSPTSRAAMAAHPAHRRESEGPPDVPTALGESLQSLGEGAVSAAKGLWHLGTTRPEQLGPELLQAEKARQADITQRASESTPLGSAALQAERTPLLGPIAAGAVDLAGKGLFGTHKEFAKTLGEQATPLAIGGIVGKVGKGAARQVSEAGNAISAVDDISKALGATTREQLESIAEAHPAIHHELVTSKTGAVFDKVGTQGYLKNAQDAQKTLWKETFDPELQKFGKNVKSMDPVAQNIRGSIDPGSAEIEPGLASSIESTAKRYEGQHWTLNKIQARQKALRAEIDGMNSAPNRAELMGKPANAAKLKELDTLTSTLYDDLSSLSGKDFSAARFRYKALKDVEDMARKTDDAVSTAEAAERATKHPLATDLLEAGGVYKAGTKLAKKTIAKRVVESNSPNALISSGLKKLGGKSRLTPIAGAKGQAAIPFTGEGVGQTPIEGQGPLFNQTESKFAGPERAAKEQKFQLRKQAEEGYKPLGETQQPELFPSGMVKPTTPAALTPPPARSFSVQRYNYPNESQASPFDVARPVPPYEVKSPVGSTSQQGFTPEGPYAAAGAPIEPTMSMDQYLTLQKLSPEARQFLGYGRKTIPPPPTGKP